MTDLPRLIRVRLQRQQDSSGEHVNPKVLSALASGILHRKQSEEAWQHLSRCPDCREALSALSSEASGSVAISWSSQSRWLWAWRSAAAIAVTCLVLAAIGWRNLLPAAAPPVLLPEAIKARDMAVVPDTLVPSPNNSPVAIQPAALKKQGQHDAALRPPKEPVRPPTLVAREPKYDAAFNRSVADPKLHPGSTVVPVNLNQADPAFQLRTLQGTVDSAAGAAKTLWTLSSTGSSANPEHRELLKSTDGGQSWRPVFVDGQTPLFAVASSGPSVWVGGAHGLLLTSRDSGTHWTPVGVTGQAGRLSGAITRIRTRGANGIEVTASTGDVWTSEDSGAHWNKAF